MIEVGEREWEAAHRDLVRLAAARAEHEHVLGGALLRALRAEAWRAIGMATFTEYAVAVAVAVAVNDHGHDHVIVHDRVD